MRETVDWIDWQAELYKRSNLEMFLGRNVVNEYFHSVDVQLELPYPDQYDRLETHYGRVPRTDIRHQ